MFLSNFRGTLHLQGSSTSFQAIYFIILIRFHRNFRQYPIYVAKKSLLCIVIDKTET